MSERRKFKRARKRLKVLYGEKDLSNVGFTRDVSLGGLYVICRTALPTAKRLHVQVFLDDKDFLLFEGVPVHVEQIPPPLRTAKEQGFGLKFMLPSEGMSSIIGATEGADIDGKRDTSFIVEYPTIDDLRAAWLRELSHGGVFVPTAAGAKRDQTVPIQIRLPFAGVSLEIRGRVLQPMAANGAQGYSVVFADTDRVKKLLGPLTVS